MQVLVDKHQKSEEQFLHSMRGSKAESVAEGVERTSNQVRTELKTAYSEYTTARYLEAQGDKKSARYMMDAFAWNLGYAIHALQDATSPKHEGFQVWDHPGFVGKVVRAYGERYYPTGARGRQLEAATRWSYDMAVTGRTPAHFFSSGGELAIPESYLSH